MKTEKIMQRSLEFRVVAEYKYRMRSSPLKDRRIISVAGRSEEGAGTYLPGKTRDISFTFRNRRAAYDAARRIRRLHRVNAKVEICD